MKNLHFYLNDEPAADTGSAPATPTDLAIAPPEATAPTTPQVVEARLSPEAINELIAKLQSKPEPEIVPTPEPVAKTEDVDPRDATMRSLLIKANQVPDSLVGLLPANPTETQKLIESPEFQALMAREKAASQIQPPSPDAPKPSAPEGDAKTAPLTPKTFKDVTTDILQEITNALL